MSEFLFFWLGFCVGVFAIAWAVEESIKSTVAKKVADGVERELLRRENAALKAAAATAVDEGGDAA